MMPESPITTPATSDYDRRFGGIRRLYGTQALAIIRQMHVAVIGVGGVGSWVAEALARSGVEHLTLIDFDNVCLTNTNRQIHATAATVGQKKIAAMAERIAMINPDCRCELIDDFVTLRNLELCLDRGYDYVVDAIDSIKFKAAILNHCRRKKIPVIMTGGAGGLTDPTQIQIADLSRTYHDPLAAKVRERLRVDYGFSRNPKRRFGIDCVFSAQQPVYPKPDGTVSCEKPGVHGVSLDCRFGYGSATFVTASFAFAAVARVIEKTIQRKLKDTARETSAENDGGGRNST